MANGGANLGRRGLFGRLAPWAALTAAGSPLVEPSVSLGGPIRSQPQFAGNSGPAGIPIRPDSIRARHEEWQLKALLYSESVPELAGAAALVRATAEGVRWTVKYTNGGNKDTAARIQARVDAFDKARAQELIFLTGEVYVAVPEDRGGTGIQDMPEDPYTLSVAEIKVALAGSNGIDQVKGPNGEWVDLVEEDSNARVPFMRVWRRAKENRWKGASPVKAAIELLDAMWLAQRVDTATQRSRLVHAGIVFWPTNAPDIPVKAGEDPTPGSRQAMLAAFQNATQQTVDMHSKGQEPSIPFVVMYDPGKGGESTKYQPEMFRVEREDLASQRQIRVEVDAVRLASALELPIESVLGMDNRNHWSAFQINADKWGVWGKPQDKLLRDEFEKRVVKPYGDAYYLETDATGLIQKPDQTDVIVKLMQLEQVTPESGVQALKDADMSGLVAKDPPVGGPSANVAPGQPSDFGKGDTNRGGGKFREQP